MPVPIVFRLVEARNKSSAMRKGVSPSWPGMLPLPQMPRLTITGVTRDSGGAALGNCNVHLFRTQDNSFVEESYSDGSGNFAFYVVGLGQLYYVVAYLPGSPDVAGTTLNTLAGIA